MIRSSTKIPRSAGPMSKGTRLTALFVLVGGALAIGIFWWLSHRTYHFATVEKGALYRCGNRGMRELATACQNAKIKTIVTLIDDREIAHEPFVGENNFCEQSGIKVIR